MSPTREIGALTPRARAVRFQSDRVRAISARLNAGGRVRAERTPPVARFGSFFVKAVPLPLLAELVPAGTPRTAHIVDTIPPSRPTSVSHSSRCSDSSDPGAVGYWTKVQWGASEAE
jgi:hypothetical protein